MSGNWISSSCLFPLPSVSSCGGIKHSNIIALTVIDCLSLNVWLLLLLIILFVWKIYSYLTHYFVIAWCFASGMIPCEPQVTLNPCTGVTLCATAWVWHLPNDLNSASVPSASLCLFCNHHFYLSSIASAWHITDIFYAISSLADFSSHSASSSPAIPTKTTTTDGWNCGPLQFIIINAFAVFLTVKGEAPAPPLSHDHLPVQPPGAPRGPGEGSLLFWHASTLTTFLATATAPPTCRALVVMAARCSQRTLKTHTLLTPIRGLHPDCAP